jgi:hypothetical protein
MMKPEDADAARLRKEIAPIKVGCGILKLRTSSLPRNRSEIFLHRSASSYPAGVAPVPHTRGLKGGVVYDWLGGPESDWAKTNGELFNSYP